MSQGSYVYDDDEKEVVEMMNIVEVSRSIEYLRALGLSEEQINNYHQYIATGVGLPVKESEVKDE